MEVSALELRQGTAHGRGPLNGSLLRLRSDEQLVELFRAGHEDAFGAIHDRYRKRLLAYTGQMLAGSGVDAEDALQDVFERAYCGLRAHHRDLALRAWLYRVAHNRCIDQLRRPTLPAAMEPDDAESRDLDPVARAEQRETLHNLILDIGRLSEQQRSALLLREMSGMSYADLAVAIGVTVPAVKSLLVRARIGLAAAIEARDTTCAQVREELATAHDQGIRPDANVRRHLRDCAHCRHFRRSVRSVSRSMAITPPLFAPVAALAKLLSGGGGAAGGTGGVLAAGGAVGTTGVLTGGITAGGVGHVAAIVAAALATGGAVAVQSSAPAPHVASIATPVSAAPRPQAPASTVAAPVFAGTLPSGGAPVSDAAQPATPGTRKGSAAGDAGSTPKPPGKSTSTSKPGDPSRTDGSASSSTGSSASGSTSSTGASGATGSSGTSGTTGSASGTTGSTGATSSSSSSTSGTSSSAATTDGTTSGTSSASTGASAGTSSSTTGTSSGS